MNDLGPRPVLLIDDSASDALLLQLAFEELASDVALHVARDGQEATAAVAALARGEGVRPRLILLDLNLPGASGLDILEQVRGDPVTAGIPVVVYSAGFSDRVRARCLDLGADLRYRKPDDYGDLLTFVQALLTDSAAELHPV